LLARKLCSSLFSHLVDVEHGEGGVLAHVRVAVLEALLDGRHQRVQQLGLLELLKCVAHSKDVTEKKVQ